MRTSDFEHGERRLNFMTQNAKARQLKPGIPEHDAEVNFVPIHRQKTSLDTPLMNQD